MISSRRFADNFASLALSSFLLEQSFLPRTCLRGDILIQTLRSQQNSNFLYQVLEQSDRFSMPLPLRITTITIAIYIIGATAKYSNAFIVMVPLSLAVWHLSRGVSMSQQNILNRLSMRLIYCRNWKKVNDSRPLGFVGYMYKDFWLPHNDIKYCGTL